MTLFQQPPSIYSNLTSPGFAKSMLKCNHQNAKPFSSMGKNYPDPSIPQEFAAGDVTQQLIQDGSKRVKTAQSFESLFDSETLSDVVLSLNNGKFTFNGHKMIIGMKSDILASLLNDVGNIDADDNRPVLELQESEEHVGAFIRFLYFIYSGAVWLHKDYVIPLHQVAAKYQVKALVKHCESYITQILDSMLTMAETMHGFSTDVLCDLYENDGFSEDMRKMCFKVLCAKFKDLAGSQRWAKCSWSLVCDLLQSDECNAEENLILTSATDWMKQNCVSDKCLIEDILTKIRYPQLHRRVLFHLRKHQAFKNFPCVQSLVENAVTFHCFRDLHEAQEEYQGVQYVPRNWAPPLPKRAPSVESVRSCRHGNRQFPRNLLNNSILVQNNQPVNYATITGQIVAHSLPLPRCDLDLGMPEISTTAGLLLQGGYPTGLEYSAISQMKGEIQNGSGEELSRPPSRNEEDILVPTCNTYETIKPGKSPSPKAKAVCSPYKNSHINGDYTGAKWSPQTVKNTADGSNNRHHGGGHSAVSEQDKSVLRVNDSCMTRSQDSTSTAIQQTLMNMSNIDGIGHLQANKQEMEGIVGEAPASNGGESQQEIIEADCKTNIVVQLPPKTKKSRIADLGLSKS